VAHTWDLRAEVRDDEYAQSIFGDYKTAKLSPVDRILCDHAIRLTREPSKMTAEDIDRLRAHGLSDRAIHDATQVIAFFNYINRIADGLGIDLEPGMPAR